MQMRAKFDTRRLLKTEKRLQKKICKVQFLHKSAVMPWLWLCYGPCWDVLPFLNQYSVVGRRTGTHKSMEGILRFASGVGARRLRRQLSIHCFRRDRYTHCELYGRTIYDRKGFMFYSINPSWIYLPKVTQPIMITFPIPNSDINF